MKIRFVVPLSLLILVSGWFIGTKTWESYTSATEIEKSLCSKTFQDGKNKDIKNCQVIVLEPETSYNFNEIKRVIPAVVNDVVDEKTKQDQTSNNVNNNSQEASTTNTQKKTKEDIRKEDVEAKLKEILPGGAELQYTDLEPGKEPTDLKTQKQWMTAIYKYQIKKNVKYQKIAGNGNENNQCKPQIPGICLEPFGQNNGHNNVTDVRNYNLYKELKKDILAAMKPQKSREKQNGNLKRGGENKKSPSTPKTPENKAAMKSQQSREKQNGNVKTGGKNKTSPSTPKTPENKAAMKPQQSREKQNGNVKTGSKNKTSPSTPKTSEKKSPNPQTDDIGLENPGN